MVSIATLLSRCLHVTCATLLFAVTIAPLFAPSASQLAPGALPPQTPPGALLLFFQGSTIAAHPGRVSMLLVAVMFVTGIVNAHRLKVGVTLAHDRQDRLRWRMNIYFLKTALMISLSPLLEYCLKTFSTTSSTLLSEEDVRHTAAVTRAYIVLLLAGVGSYSKVFREESIERGRITVTPSVAAAADSKPVSPPKNKHA
jgi:hypothetical protein